MNSTGGRCHNNARCESMWARFKEELLYGRYNNSKMRVEELKNLSEDILLVIGIIEESALLMVAYHR